MRRCLVSLAAALALTAALMPPAQAEDLSSGMWDNGVVGSSSYRQASLFTTWDGLKAYAEMTGSIQTTWNLQELSARGSAYRYWKLHVDTTIKPTRKSSEYTIANDNLWTRVSVWPVGATKLQKWSTGSKTVSATKCATASLGLGQSLGPFNAGLTLANWSFCNRVKLVSTQNPQDIWRQHYVVRDFENAKNYGVVYILKTKRHEMPRFNIDVDFPKDTGSGHNVTSLVGGYLKVTPRSGRY
jgi:hypothetical protein